MFEIISQQPYEYKQECLIVGLYHSSHTFAGKLQQLDHLFNEKLTELIKSGDISAKWKSVFTLHTLGQIKTKRLIFIGLGKEKELTSEKLKEALGRTFKETKKLKLTSFSIALDTFVTDQIKHREVAATISEAFALSTYQFASYEQKSNIPEVHVKKLHVFTEGDKKEVNAGLIFGDALGKATNFARSLVNMPGNMLTATDLANEALKLAEKYGFEVEILEKDEMEKLGMGALLAVNKGSVEPPKMIVLKYMGTSEWEDVIGLVGKGVTFDTGGYSLKPKSGIVDMKTDMGGAATVLGVMQAIGALRPSQNVLAVIPATDNMISGGALKPDDVITSLSGKTIEVLNTDAEGRLVLADGMTFAKQHGADYLIDVATLTGGVIVALGTDKTGALSNNDALFKQVMEASQQSGEFIWRLPYTDKDKERIRSSKIADLNNSPGREGHAIMGGGFVGEFAEDTPWVHLDIAGTATTDVNNDLGPKGATGVMVRTLVRFIHTFKSL